MRRLVLILSIALVTGACAEDRSAQGPSEEGTATASATATTEAPTMGDGGVKVTGSMDAKPTVTLPGGAPPAELLFSDVTAGTGAEATSGSTVTAHYVGIAWSSKQEFDSSWDRGEPAQFPLDQVIRGWQLAIPGEKVGGRRLLVIPPELGYGANPPPGSGIGVNDTLVFVVDLKAVA